jgi:hypothetical protein
MVDNPASDSFYSALFAIDGELMGVRQGRLSDLSRAG